MTLPTRKIDPPPETSEITDVQLQPMHRGRLKAFATVILDRVFVVRGIKIIEGHDRMFVAMPSRKMNDGTYQDVAHPSSQIYRDYLEEVVLEVYRERTAEAPVSHPERP